MKDRGGITRKGSQKKLVDFFESHGNLFLFLFIINIIFFFYIYIQILNINDL